MFVWNEETEQTEHKQTTMARDQKKHADDKTAPGRLRYRFGRRLAIRSEDDGARTGFWCGRVYQVHRPAQIERQLQTKRGPLLLEGHLEVGYARIAELRKGLGVASVQHPRLSVRRDDARRCEVVLQMLTREGGVLQEDRRSPPQLAPVATLGCKVEARERPGASSCACWTPAEYDSLAEAHDCGGAPLQSTYVDGSWFAADAMLAGGEVAFEDMAQPQLKDELAVRGEARSGLKHVLQRRLHALLVQAAIEARREDAEMGEAGEGDEEGGGEREEEGEEEEGEEGEEEEGEEADGEDGEEDKEEPEFDSSGDEIPMPVKRRRP